MRKIYLLLLIMVGLSSKVLAEKGTLVLKGPEGYQVLALSPNGKWACGVYDGNNLGFVWDLENNIVTNLDKGGSSFANDVSDEGIVCGNFYCDIINDNEAPGVTGGYWKDGVYTPLKDENGNVIANCNAQSISADGRYIAGVLVESNGRYQPAIWKDGILEERLNTKQHHGGVFGMSNDGSIILGWYDYAAPGIQANRQPCYWNRELNPLGITESDRGGFLQVSAISPNNRYIAAHVGVPDPNSEYMMQDVLYDIVDKDTIYIGIPFLEAIDPDGKISCNDVWDDGSVIIRLNSADVTKGVWDDYIYHKDGTYQRVVDYIKEDYKSTLPNGFSRVGWGFFSTDRKVYAGLCMKFTGGNTIYQPVVWRSDEEIDTPKPVALTAEILPSTINVLLKWKQPLNNGEQLTGYRVYAKDKKVADLPADQLEYVYDNSKTLYDRITFKVVAMYNEVESESNSVEIKLQDVRYAEPPTRFTAYHANYNDVVLKWNAPITGYDVNLRHHNNVPTVPFGSNVPKTFLAGIDFSKYVIASYADYYELTAVEFYYGDPVNDMDLYIYSNGKEVAKQKIDQTKLISGRKNAVRLNEPLTLPEDGDISVVIRVDITTGALPLQMAEGPAKEGGDLISLDDGETWSTVRELTSGIYNYNWVIGLLLESNGRSQGGDPAPPITRSAMSPTVYEYIVYRDGEELTRITPDNDAQTSFELKDKDVVAGYHDYGVSVRYTTNKISKPTVQHVYVASKKLDVCAAPVNVKGAVNMESKEMTLTWELPESSDVSYTNWSYQTGMYIAGLTGWMQAIRLSPDKLEPFIGYKITTVNFFPCAEADFAVHIFENKEEISSQDVMDYALNSINHVRLDNPVEIKRSNEYWIIIEVFDARKDTPVLGTDNSYPVIDGRWYSENGKGFQTDSQSAGGNWMIGVNIERTDGGTSPEVSYKVYMDDVLLGENISEKQLVTSIADKTEKTAKVSVSAVYPIGERRSDNVIVSLDPSSIGKNEITSVKVYPNPASSYIKIEGNVSSIVMTDISGKQVYNGVATIIDVTQFVPGMYLLKSVIDGKSYINKVQIIK